VIITIPNKKKKRKKRKEKKKKEKEEKKKKKRKNNIFPRSTRAPRVLQERINRMVNVKGKYLHRLVILNPLVAT